MSVDRFSDSEAPRLAASLSYYAVFSLFPLLLVLGAVAESALGDSQALRDRVSGMAADGRFELYKSTAKHEGDVGRKQHGFPLQDEVAA